MNNKILCVDDEESILKGFQLNLRKDLSCTLLPMVWKDWKFLTGNKDLRLCFRICACANGRATMLSEIKKRDPEVVTVLLTGHTDFESAMSAVNEGSIFRMLSKPCPPEMLIRVLNDGLAKTT